MKKGLFFVVIVMLSVFCTGCVKYSYNIVVDDKDTVSVSKTQAINFSFFENYDPNFKKQFDESMLESSDEFKKEGYEVQSYSDDTYRGLTLIKKNLSFEDASDALKDDFGNEENIFSIHRNGLSKTYSIHFLYDVKKAMNNMSEKESPFKNNSNDENTLIVNGEKIDVVSKTAQTDPQTGEVVETVKYADGSVSTTRYNPQEQQKFNNALGETFNSIPGLKPVADLTIKIPKKATNHNAAKVISDTEYYWDLSADEQPVEIILEYKKFDFSTAGPILSILVIMGILCFMIYKSKADA